MKVNYKGIGKVISRLQKNGSITQGEAMELIACVVRAEISTRARTCVRTRKGRSAAE